MVMNKSISKTVHTPVFYASPQPSASTSNTHLADIRTSYLDSLSRKHIALAQIVEEIPGEGEVDPESSNRVELLRKRVIGAFELAKGEPADGKWTEVAQLLRLRVTRGRSRWLGSSREGRTIVSNTGWINARTESEWVEWERKWNEEDKVKRKVESWKEKLATHPLPPSVISISDDSEGTKVQLSLVKGKARATDNVDSAVAPKKAPVRTTGTTLLNASGRDPRDPAALGFAVMKRSSLTLNGKPKHTAKPLADSNIAGPSKPNPTLHARVPNSSNAGDKPERRNIMDISETSFLPPSFPSQLLTSTPNDKTDRRQKPPPIPPISSTSPLPSSPNTYAYGRSKTHLDVTSSLTELPTTPKQGTELTTGPTHAKRQRSVTPEQATKKARTMPPLPSSGGMGPPSSPQPLATEDPASPSMAITLKRSGKFSTLKGRSPSLKYAIKTPLQKYIVATMSPLVSLDKSKEKKTNIDRETLGEESKANDADEPNSSSPFQDPLPLDNPLVAGLAVGLGYDAASPTKSLSSLAESDSDSDEDGSNVNLVHDIDDDFNPPFASTQAQGKNIGLGLGTTKGSSGFGWMGYSSQFDVNGKVDQVSKFMEKDVDYDGWLSDLPP